jgi:dolichyl-phosphate-mannose--protein O-mannosyl transferase
VTDPTIAAHWPLVMTDLPVGLLSVTSVLICIQTLCHWSAANLCLLAITLGLTLSVKHSGLISFGFTGALGLATLLWQFRNSRHVALRRSLTYLLVLAGAVVILWGSVSVPLLRG